MTLPSARELAIRVADHPGHLRLAAQPIVDVAAGKVGGYELLARLPDAWHIGPEEFFAAADEAGVRPRSPPTCCSGPSSCATSCRPARS